MGKDTRFDLIGIGNNVRLGKQGSRIKNSGGVIEARNNNDDAYVKLRADHPAGPNDLVTLKYLQTRANVIVTGQINGGSPPAAGAVGTVYICTTAGGAYNLKSLYYDNGTTWEEIVPVEGMTIKITQDLTGGTDEYLGDHLYLWDAQGATWIDIGAAPSDSELVKSKLITITWEDVGTNLLKTIPAGARVLQVKINVTQVFDGSNPTVIVGDATDADRHAAADESDLAEVGLYTTEIDYFYGSETAVNATLSAAGVSQGQATVAISYALV